MSNKANKQGWLWLFPLSVLVLCLVLPVQVAAEQPVQVQATVKPLLEVDGYIFKDLNANGQLDPYEDSASFS